MKVLGLDPGYDRLGAALVERRDGQDRLIFSDCLRSDPKLPFPERLAGLGQEIERLLKKRRPDLVAIERLFFSRNQKTASRVSEVRGVIIYLAAKHRRPVVEYTPSEVKMTISGYGQATKQQMTAMIKRLVKLPTRPKYDDEIDAIATALTALARER